MAMDNAEISFPEDPAQLMQHESVEVVLSLNTRQGDHRSLLGGRCTTHHLRPNGAIVVVKPQFAGSYPCPLKRSDSVRVRFKRGTQPPLEIDGSVSWVRPKAYLPSGLAVSLIGVTFSWNADEMALEVAAFLA